MLPAADRIGKPSRFYVNLGDKVMAPARREEGVLPYSTEHYGPLSCYNSTVAGSHYHVLFLHSWR
jgi:hypothetical protein